MLLVRRGRFAGTVTFLVMFPMLRRMCYAFTSSVKDKVAEACSHLTTNPPSLLPDRHLTSFL